MQYNSSSNYNPNSNSLVKNGLKKSFKLTKKQSSGFTLIEVIIGIVTMSIALSVITTLLLPTAEQSAQQIHQIRAAELGQSLMNEIVGKAFDENSDMAGGKDRCGEALQANCTGNASLGPDGETSVAEYNDVDDYHGVDQNDLTLDGLYQGFTVSISVCNDANYDGSCTGDIETAKLITITITDSSQNPITFAIYKANY